MSSAQAEADHRTGVGGGASDDGGSLIDNVRDTDDVGHDWLPPPPPLAPGAASGLRKQFRKRRPKSVEEDHADIADRMSGALAEMAPCKDGTVEMCRHLPVNRATTTCSVSMSKRRGSKRAASTPATNASLDGGGGGAPNKKLKPKAIPATDGPSAAAGSLRTHSLDPIRSISVAPTVLVCGTHPSRKSLADPTETVLTAKEVRLRGGKGPQNYGASGNSFWNIAGTALGFDRSRIGYDEQCKAFTDAGRLHFAFQWVCRGVEGDTAHVGVHSSM
jgi:hypothetical protein